MVEKPSGKYDAELIEIAVDEPAGIRDIVPAMLDGIGKLAELDKAKINVIPTPTLPPVQRRRARKFKRN